MEKELLPIGSVVLLKNSTARAMIAGYLSVANSDQSRVYDYSGFQFPVGYMRDDEILCFDDTDIEQVVVYGYKDLEESVFMGKLMSEKDEMKKKFMERK